MYVNPQAGLLDADAPSVPSKRATLLPDTMTAVITVRDGDSVRRIVLPAGEPGAEAPALPGERAEVPMGTKVQLPAESVTTLQPLLDALREVEGAL